MRYLWGLVLVAIGAGYLAAGMGYISYDQISQIWMWWPLILVFIGVDILTKRLKYGWLVMILLTIISGLAIYNFSFSSNPVQIIGGVGQQSNDVKTSAIAIEKKEGYKSAEIQVDTGAVDFEIGGQTDAVVSGKLDSNFAEVQSTVTDDSSTAKVDISTVSFRHQMMWLGRNIKNDLRLALNNSLATKLVVNSGASDINFDLSKYVISGLEINSGASSIKVKLGDLIQDKAVVNIDTGASSVMFEVPKGLGVRILTESGLSSNDFQGFTKVGDYYENESYKTSGKKIELNLRTGASSVSVKQY